MLERLLILLALAALIAAVWALLRWWRRRLLAALADQQPFAAILPVSGPAVVAFTLPTCAECRARQAPALERLRGQVDSAVTITTLAADRHGDLLARLGIMTVPATAVLDAIGAVRAINQGFADEARLRRQLAGLPE